MWEEQNLASPGAQTDPAGPESYADLQSILFPSFNPLDSEAGESSAGVLMAKPHHRLRAGTQQVISLHRHKKGEQENGFRGDYRTNASSTSNGLSRELFDWIRPLLVLKKWVIGILQRTKNAKFCQMWPGTTKHIIRVSFLNWDLYIIRKLNK